MVSLKADYVEVWAASQNLPLARFAHATRSIAAAGLDMLEFSSAEKLMAELRGFDSIVSWYGAGRPEFRTVVQDLPFQFHPAMPPAGCSMHAADYFATQVGSALPAIPRVDCPRTDAGFAVIHPFAGSPKKCWPLDRYRELARRLRMPVRWCAGPEEHLADAVRVENLYDLACWLASARLYIGNDSGITHLAAATGAPVVALFGPTDPRIWAPRGNQISVIAKPSLNDIAVEEVLDSLGNVD